MIFSSAYLEFAQKRGDTRWLAQFREATTFMSSTKVVTLSSAYGCFTCLQDTLRAFLKELPPGSPPLLKEGLEAAHKKLSDYLTDFNKSPYFMWAACKWRISLYLSNY